MMAVVIVPFVIGYPILAIFSLPIFLSALMGVSFKSTTQQHKVQSKQRSLKSNNQVVSHKQLIKVA